jgi:RNA polymerase sigma factor (sigma-70 family)
MNSFYRAAAAGRYPRLKDRHDLWKMLVTFTAHKVSKQFRRQRAQKRGGGHVRGESALDRAGESDGDHGIHDVLGREPSPELVAMMAETCDDLVGQLGDESLQTIALSKLEGYTNAEIAEQLGVTERSVERKLARIRKRWSEINET